MDVNEITGTLFVSVWETMERVCDVSTDDRHDAPTVFIELDRQITRRQCDYVLISPPKLESEYGKPVSVIEWDKGLGQTIRLLITLIQAVISASQTNLFQLSDLLVC